MAVAASSFTLTVEEVRQETPEVRTFRFALAPGVWIAFAPGQFLSFHFADDPKNERSYSIASSPLDKGFIEVSLAAAGVFTRRFFELRPGDTIGARGPIGQFIFREGASHSVLIVGGTGITPARSIIRYAAQKKLPGKLSLIYSARTPSDFLYSSELEDWARGGACAVHLTITRPHQLKEGQGWQGLVGRIDALMLRRLIRDFDTAQFYICGPAKFVEDVASALAGIGTASDRIHFERVGQP